MNFNKIVSGLITFIFLSGTVLAQDTIENKTDEILKRLIDENGPGISVTIKKDNEVLLQKCYGYANLEKNIPMTPEIKFYLGTLTKQFTAMGIMILKDEGKLDYKDKINKYLNNLPSYTERLTIEHLIEESSGLPFFNTRNNNQEATLQDVLEFLNTKDRLTFSPGKKAMSNPANFALLTLILEEVSETGYRKFVKDNIFKPLNMNDSEVFKGGWFYKIKNKALGYQNVGSQDSAVYEKLDNNLEKDYLKGVIGIYASTTDMQKWLHAWNSEKLVERNTLSGSQRINFIRGAKEFYGYGWRKAFNNGQKYLYQGGVGSGNTHILLKLPRENIEVMILNNQRAVFGLRKRAFELLNLAADKQYEIR